MVLHTVNSLKEQLLFNIFNQYRFLDINIDNEGKNKMLFFPLLVLITINII